MPIIWRCAASSFRAISPHLIASREGRAWRIHVRVGRRRHRQSPRRRTAEEAGEDRSPARAVRRRGPGTDRALWRRYRYAVRESTVETMSRARDHRIRVLGVGSPQHLRSCPRTLPGHRRAGAGYVATNFGTAPCSGRAASPAGVLRGCNRSCREARRSRCAEGREARATLGMTMVLLPAEALRAPGWKSRCRVETDIPDIGLKVE